MLFIYAGFFVILTGLLFFLYKERINFNNEIDTAKFAEFGDFIGGIVGTLLALAGVILFYIALID